MKYNNSGRTYQVDSIEYNGEIINVFGTSITDMGMGYTVYFNGDEVYFETFDEAYNFAKDNTRDTFVEAPLTESNSFEESVDIVPIIKEVFSQSAHIDKDSIFVYTFEEDKICISFMTDCIGEAGSCDVEREVYSEGRDEDGYAIYGTSVNFTGDLEDVTILETSITIADLKELVNKVNDKLAAENKMIRLNIDDINDQSFEIDHKEYDAESIDDYRLEYDLLQDPFAADIKWTGKVLASIDVSIIDLSNDKAIEIESATSINEANQADTINKTDKDYFDKLVAEATPIIERVFDKHPGVSDTIVGDTDWKASTIYVSSIVNCECVGTDYYGEIDSENPSASDIRSAQYFEDIDIVKTVLTEADVDNLIKEINIELEKANQPIRLTERATEFEYDYVEITLDEVNSYDVEQGDNGIGSYEYWGDVGYDSRPYTYLTDVEFTGIVPVAFDIEIKVL